MKPYIYSLLAITIICCGTQAMEIPFALTIQQANQFLQKPELTDKASFTTIQAHERDLSTITKKARDLLPSLDQSNQQTVTNWIQKIGNKNKSGIQELKTIIYNAYLPQHPDELCKEISHIISELGNSTPMKHYYHTDITTLAALLQKQIDDAGKTNMIDTHLSTLRNEPSHEQDRAQIKDYFANLCREMIDKKITVPAPEAQQIAIAVETQKPIPAALQAREKVLNIKFQENAESNILPPVEKYHEQKKLPQKGLVVTVPRPKETLDQSVSEAASKKIPTEPHKKNKFEPEIPAPSIATIEQPNVSLLPTEPEALQKLLSQEPSNIVPVFPARQPIFQPRQSWWSRIQENIAGAYTRARAVFSLWWNRNR